MLQSSYVNVRCQEAPNQLGDKAVAYCAQSICNLWSTSLFPISDDETTNFMWLRINMDNCLPKTKTADTT